MNKRMKRERDVCHKRKRWQRIIASMAALLILFTTTNGLSVYAAEDTPEDPIIEETLGSTGPFSYYAIEFRRTDDEGNIKSYATAEVGNIKVSDVMSALGLTGDADTVTVLDNSGYVSLGYVFEEQREDGWYICTTAVPSQPTTGEPYTGGLFNADDPKIEKSLYYSDFRDLDIVIKTINGGEYPVTMKFIATPIQKNNPGSVSGVTVGDTIYTFASGMPLSTVYIDNDYFQTPSKWDKCSDDIDPGFVFSVPSDYDFKSDSLSDGTWMIYDPAQEEATQLKTGIENEFKGDLFYFIFDNAAILSNGSVANVKITYSDVCITIDDRATEENGGFPYAISLACGKKVMAHTNDNRSGGSGGYINSYSAAVRMNATIQIVDDAGNPIDGSFIACIEGLNITKTGTQVTKPLYNGKQFDFWSEAVQVNGKTLSDLYVRPNDDEEEPISGIPGDTSEHFQRKWYYSYVTKNDEGIKFTGLQWAVPDGTVDPETGEENLVNASGKNDYYSAGFVTTVDAKEGIQLRSYEAGNYNLGVETAYMNGYSIWHRIRSSSTRGGTIRTTTEGNVGGLLSDDGTVLDPGTYVVPDGKTVIYTMTPDPGYELDKVIVKSDSLSYSDGTDITTDVLKNEVHDANGGIHYTYTFLADKENPQNNHENQAIHVKWKKSTSANLTVNKTAVGDDGTFTFRIKVDGQQVTRDAWKAVASWETIWRENYSFAHITSVSYPLVLDGVTYNDDVERMTFADDSYKLLLYGSCDENNTPTSEPLTNGSDDLTLYKVLDLEGNPYRIEIDGTPYELYSDITDWAVSGETGENEANFWIHDEEDQVDNYFDISTVTEISTPDTVDLSQYGGNLVPGTKDLYKFKIETTDGEGSITLTGLPYGYHYLVQELSQNGWKLIEYGNTIGDLTTNKTATFKNERKTGSLIVKKVVDGNAPIAGKEFSFTVTLASKINGEYGDMIFENGVAEFTLKGGDSKKATGLPSGIAYAVTEKDYIADGYVTNKTGDTGTIIEDEELTAEFTNTRNANGSLTISKQLAGNDTDSTKEFTFTITLNDTAINGEYSGVTFTNGVATITLKGGESKTIEGLPNGTGYTITEADYSSEGYVTTSVGATGEIDETAPKVAEFTNTRNTYGDLVVTKTVKGNAASTTKEFSFAVTLSDKSINGTYGDMTFINGVATFSLKHRESKTAKDLPNGVTYEVIESDYAGYTTTATGDSGTIVGGSTQTAAFTNRKNTTPPPDEPGDDPTTGGLTVSKSVTGDGADQNKEFIFTVTLSDKTINGTYGGMTFTNGVAEFTLKGGESKKATGLPEGITYVVTEADYTSDGYVTTKTGETGTITGGSVKTAAFTNTKTSTPPPPDNPPDTPPATPEYGSLTVKKTVTGDLADKNKEFTFTITFNAEGSYSYTGSRSGTVKSGGTVLLKHGESITISGLPAGTTYAVTESGHSGYRAYASGNTGTIVANNVCTAAFTNVRSSVPQTGDDSNLALWLSITGAAGVGMMLTVLFGRKRKGKHRPAR